MRVWSAALLLFVLANVLFVVSPFWDAVLLSRDQDIVVWQAKHDALENGVLRGVEGVILGDSQAMGGLLPDRLKEKTDITFYNMALPANMPEGVEAQLPLLEKHAPESRVWIVNVSPIFLFKSDVVRAFHMYARTELARRSPAASIRLRGLIDSPAQLLHQAFLFVPFYRANDGFSAHISFLADGRGIPPSGPVLRRFSVRKEENLRVLSILGRNEGWWIWKTQSADEPCDAPQAEKLPVLTAYDRRPESEDALRRLLTRAISRPDRKVILVQIPLSSTWESSAPPGIYERLDQSLGIITRGLDRVTILPRSVKRSWSFHDWTHLSRCGALEFTDDVSREIVRIVQKK